jgi:hypothetical protein
MVIFWIDPERARPLLIHGERPLAASGIDLISRFTIYSS